MGSKPSIAETRLTIRCLRERAQNFVASIDGFPDEGAVRGSSADVGLEQPSQEPANLSGFSTHGTDRRHAVHGTRAGPWRVPQVRRVPVRPGADRPLLGRAPLSNPQARLGRGQASMSIARSGNGAYCCAPKMSPAPALPEGRLRRIAKAGLVTRSWATRSL